MFDAVAALGDLRTALIRGTYDLDDFVRQFDAVLHGSDFAGDPLSRELPAPLRELANRAEVIRWTATDDAVRPRLLALLDDAVRLLPPRAD